MSNNESTIASTTDNVSNPQPVCVQASAVPDLESLMATVKLHLDESNASVVSKLDELVVQSKLYNQNMTKQLRIQKLNWAIENAHIGAFHCQVHSMFPDKQMVSPAAGELSSSSRALVIILCNFKNDEGTVICNCACNGNDKQLFRDKISKQIMLLTGQKPRITEKGIIYES